MPSTLNSSQSPAPDANVELVRDFIRTVYTAHLSDDDSLSKYLDSLQPDSKLGSIALDMQLLFQLLTTRDLPGTDREDTLAYLMQAHKSINRFSDKILGIRTLLAKAIAHEQVLDIPEGAPIQILQSGPVDDRNNWALDCDEGPIELTYENNQPTIAQTIVKSLVVKILDDGSGVLPTVDGNEAKEWLNGQGFRISKDFTFASTLVRDPAQEGFSMRAYVPEGLLHRLIDEHVSRENLLAKHGINLKA